MRCNTDHHTVNFIKGDKPELHHIAFELKDIVAHAERLRDVRDRRQMPILWGPVRHGPGHNVATYHRNPDEHTVELYIELDQMKDEELGYFDPRPWHRDTPQFPKTWTPGKTTIWGLTPEDDFHRTRCDRRSRLRRCRHRERMIQYALAKRDGHRALTEMPASRACSSRLGPHRRRLQRHAARAPHQIELEVD